MRTGQEYVESLRDGRRLFIDGELVTDVTEYPPMQRVINSVAETFQLQHDSVYQEVVTYVSPTSSDRVSTTYLPTRTYEEFLQHHRCDYARTDFTYGIMGRLTDFMSAFLLDQEISLRAGGFTDADYNNPELQPLVDRLLNGPDINAEDRLQLMKLAWDMTSEHFGSRQHLYENYYSGDPIRNRVNWYQHPKRVECQEMVKRLLEW